MSYIYGDRLRVWYPYWLHVKRPFWKVPDSGEFRQIRGQSGHNNSVTITRIYYLLRIPKPQTVFF